MWLLLPSQPGSNLFIEQVKAAASNSQLAANSYQSLSSANANSNPSDSCKLVQRCQVSPSVSLVSPPPPLDPLHTHTYSGIGSGVAEAPPLVVCDISLWL